MTVITCSGFDYAFDTEACARCHGRCCRGRAGNIWVTAREMARICQFHKTHLIDGMHRFFYKKDNQYIIREHRVHGEYDCIFLTRDRGCAIYRVRPRQCRTFPFWHCLKGDMDALKRQCPGVRDLLTSPAVPPVSG